MCSTNTELVYSVPGGSYRWAHGDLYRPERLGVIQTRPVWDCHVGLPIKPDSPTPTTPGRFSAVRHGSPRRVVCGIDIGWLPDQRRPRSTCTTHLGFLCVDRTPIDGDWPGPEEDAVARALEALDLSEARKKECLALENGSREATKTSDGRGAEGGLVVFQSFWALNVRMRSSTVSASQAQICVHLMLEAAQS